MSRVVVQITSSGLASSFGPSMLTLYALCDDGTVWYVNSDNRTRWKRIADIPQE